MEHHGLIFQALQIQNLTLEVDLLQHLLDRICVEEDQVMLLQQKSLQGQQKQLRLKH